MVYFSQERHYSESEMDSSFVTLSQNDIEKEA